jgi:hypothetical protein
MSPSKPSLLAGVKHEITAFGDDLRKLAVAHWQLLRIELESDAMAVARLAVMLVAAGVMVLTALPLFAVFLADVLDGCCGIARWGWLLIFGLGLLAAAPVTAFVAWRWFRARFTALAETREEIREHLVWLREWVGKDEG